MAGKIGHFGSSKSIRGSERRADVASGLRPVAPSVHAGFVRECTIGHRALPAGAWKLSLGLCDAA